MPDYALCKQEKCPKARECCRFLAVPDTYQTYFAPKFDENGCKFFWDVKIGAPFKLRGKRDA